MTGPQMLDIGFAPADVNELIADVKASGARAVGLYILNWSAPGTVVSAAYAKAVRAAGIEVLPIVTPGMNPPPVSGVPAIFEQWGRVNDQNYVGLDIEQPGVDTPAASWVAGFVSTLAGAGYKVMEYTNLRALYPYGELWAVNWNEAPPALELQPGQDAVQWGVPYTGPASGKQYDQDLLAPNVLVDPPPPPAPPPSEVTDMPLIGTRPDGTRDVFTILPTVNGVSTAKHVYVPASGAPEYDDALPGSWCDLVTVSYNANGTIDVYGHGWENGAGGELFKLSWSQAAGWTGPWEVMG